MKLPVPFETIINYNNKTGMKSRRKFKQHMITDGINMCLLPVKYPDSKTRRQTRNLCYF